MIASNSFFRDEPAFYTTANYYWPGYYDSGAEDDRDPKIIRRRFQEHLQALRGKEPAFVKLETRRPGKRPAARWGSRPREQRTRA